jgi:hypothetical protein
MLGHVIAVIGPPAVGKTTLTTQLGQRPFHGVFHLLEHLPELPSEMSANLEPYECIDDFTAIASVHTCIELAIREGRMGTLLLDGFPGTATQVNLFLSLLQQLAPGCVAAAVELVAGLEALATRGACLPSYQARHRRYDGFVAGTRRAFMTADVAVTQLDTNCSPERATERLVALIACVGEEKHAK